MAQSQAASACGSALDRRRGTLRPRPAHRLRCGHGRRRHGSASTIRSSRCGRRTIACGPTCASSHVRALPLEAASRASSDPPPDMSKRSCSCRPPARERFDGLRAVAEVVEVDGPARATLDLQGQCARCASAAFSASSAKAVRRLGGALCRRRVSSTASTGRSRHVFLSGRIAVPVLSGANIGGIELRLRSHRARRPDMMISGTVARV